MLNASNEFRTLAAQGAPLLIKGQLTLASGETMAISGEDFMRGTAKFTEATSSSGSFDLGAAVVGSFNATLDNADGHWDAVDFTGSKIVVSVGYELASGAAEWLRKGTYWVEQPSSYGGSLPLSCVDSMSLFDRPFSEVGLTASTATAAVVVQEICSTCGVSLLSSSFANATTALSLSSLGENLSCRDVLAHVAQATGNWCRITADARLKIGWYDRAAFDGEDWLDGGIFDPASPYVSGDAADGGTLLPWTVGTAVNGGDFSRHSWIYVNKYTSATVIADDVVITGVRVTASDEKMSDGSVGEKGEVAVYGTEGYVLEVAGNPLIAYGQAASFAGKIGPQAVGMRFRPFDAQAITDPTVEAGDAAVIVDRRQNAFRTYLTRVEHKAGACTALACTAKTPLRNSAMSSTLSTTVSQIAADYARREKIAREAALEALQDDLENSPGMYTTTNADASGATTWLIHDKSTLAESQFVWKINAGGFGMSIDGGETYTYGLDKWGTAILDSIYAVGINADYIKTGSLRVSKNNKTVFSADVDTGSCNIGGFTVDAAHVKNECLDLSSDGLAFKFRNNSIGLIGTSALAGGPTNNGGLAFHLDGPGTFMSWAVASGSSGIYSDILLYTKSSVGSYEANSLNFGCKIDAHNYVMRRVWIDPNTGGANGGATGTLNFVRIDSISSDGSIMGCPGRYMTFRNGILVDGAF